MDYQKEFFDASYQKLVDAIQGIPDDIAADIYVFSFIWSLGNTYSEPIFEFCYNTESQFKASINEAYDEMEAKWLYDFWLHDHWGWFKIDGQDDELWQNWVKSTPYYLTAEKEIELRDNDEEKFWECFEGINKMLEDTIIDLSQKLHAEGVFIKKFGKPIPVIVQFYEPGPEQVEWTLRANPQGLVDEYASWDYFK